jgi:hypothetical protein
MNELTRGLCGLIRRVRDRVEGRITNVRAITSVKYARHCYEELGRAGGQAR